MPCELHLAQFLSAIGQHLNCIFKKGLRSGPLQYSSKPDQVCPAPSKSQQNKEAAELGTDYPTEQHQCWNPTLN